MPMELPESLSRGDWPFSAEMDMLRRAQTMNDSLDAKIRSLTRDFRAHRFYPRRTEIRSLQLRVHHTFTLPVPGTDDGATPGAPGRWALHLQAVDTSSGTPTPVNLVHYFRKVSIELDPRLYSDSMVEWTCFQKGNHEVHALEVARVGHTPHTVRIKLQTSHPIERYVLSDELRMALAPYFANTAALSYTKPDIIMAMWEYIKRKNLIKEDDCRVALCDNTLRSLFNCDSLPFASIVVALRPHLSAAPALDFEYHLSLAVGEEADPTKPLDEKVVNVDVGHVDDVEKAREAALLEWEELQQEQQKEMELLQRQESHILSQLHAYTRKHDWMQQFALDPAGFIADLVKSQQADQQILTAEAETDEISLPHPNQFSQPWVREVVSELLIPPPNN